LVWYRVKVKLNFYSSHYSICGDLSFVKKFPTYFIELLASNRCAP
jgi:hypothetical protein